jgi:hypothetical protein
MKPAGRRFTMSEPMATGRDWRALENEFTALGVDVSAPGFCDSQPFIAAEANDPVLLLKYGRYVQARPYDAAYADRVRRRVSVVAAFLAGEWARDGRLGADIDASAVALKFLQREGIWGYSAVGSLVVEFINPPGRRILHHFVPEANPAVPGHAWLCVPPFDIFDTTIQAQSGFTAAERACLSPILAEEVPREVDVTLDELAEPEMLALFYADQGRPAQLNDFVSNALRQYWQQSPPKIVASESARLKYIECGVIGGDGESLDNMENLHASFLARFPEV